MSFFVCFSSTSGLVGLATGILALLCLIKIQAMAQLNSPDMLPQPAKNVMIRLCGSRKCPCRPQRSSLENPRGRGVSEDINFKESMKINWNFQRVWGGCLNKKPSVRWVSITIHCTSHCIVSIKFFACVL